MTPKRNEASKQATDQASSYTHKKSPNSNTTGKERDTIIPTKDKSPDDLEILD